MPGYSRTVRRIALACASAISTPIGVWPVVPITATGWPSTCALPHKKSFCSTIAWPSGNSASASFFQSISGSLAVC